MDDDVICGTHGSTPKRYACRHVAAGVACGWHTSDADADVGWCDWCEERLDRAGEWTPELNEDMRLVCTHCFAGARAANEKVPALARGTATRLTADEQSDLLRGAFERTQALQRSAQTRWPIGGGGRWDFDDEKRTITFSDAGAPTCVADVRLVGSYSTNSNSFQWSWVLYPPDEPMVRGVTGLPEFGEVRGIEALTRRYWDCAIEEAWEMTSIAAYVLGCEAVYRAPFDDLYWFMLLDNFRVSA